MRQTTKAYLKEDGRTREKSGSGKNRIMTIYQYFCDYERKEIDEVLSSLTNEEKELLFLRYGNDLDNPISGKLPKDKAYKFTAY